MVIRVEATKKSKSYQKATADSMSTVQRLHRQLASGPLKSELRTVSESIHAARALYFQIQGAGISVDDFNVRVAYMTPDFSALYTTQFIPGQEAKINAELSGQCSIVVGLAFGIRDWELKNWILGSRPFLRTPLVEMAFANWMQQTLLENT